MAKMKNRQRIVAPNLHNMGCPVSQTPGLGAAAASPLSPSAFGFGPFSRCCMRRWSGSALPGSGSIGTRLRGEREASASPGNSLWHADGGQGSFPIFFPPKNSSSSGRPGSPYYKQHAYLLWSTKEFLRKRLGLFGDAFARSDSILTIRLQPCAMRRMVERTQLTELRRETLGEKDLLQMKCCNPNGGFIHQEST